MYVHTHIHCYIAGLFGRRILFGSLLQFTPGEKEEEEEQLPQPGGGEGNAVGVGKEEPLPQPGEGDADADSYWNRSRIQSAEAVPIRVVRRHPTLYDSQIRGMCVSVCVQHFVTFKCNLCNSRRCCSREQRAEADAALPRVQIGYIRTRC